MYVREDVGVLVLKFLYGYVCLTIMLCMYIYIYTQIMFVYMVELMSKRKILDLLRQTIKF